jgi:hypothetical protein
MWRVRPLTRVVSLARAVRHLLLETQISSEAFAELEEDVLEGLAFLPQSRETKKLVKAITKLFARAEKALAKSNEPLARRYLSDIADRLEKLGA